MEKERFKVYVECELGENQEVVRTLTLILDSDELEHLKYDLEGFGCVVWEYKSLEGEIINDLMIKRIVKCMRELK